MKAEGTATLTGTDNGQRGLNILVISQYYYPENFQINEICEELVKRGHRVTVLTGLPNYPTGKIPAQYRHGKLRHEVRNGVTILRNFEIGRRHGAIGLGLNYLSFWLSGSRAARHLKEEFDVVLAYQLSPVFSAIPGCVYKKKHKTPYIIYCCDIWPEALKLMIRSEKNPIFGAVKRMSRKIYNSADRVLLQTRYFYPYFKEVHGMGEDRLRYLPQFASDEYLSGDYRSDNGVYDFVFLGNTGIAQNLDRVIGAVDRIRDVPGFRLHIVGDGSCLAGLKKLVEEKDLGDLVKFYGRRPVEEMPEFYRLADACLVSLGNENMTGLTLPAKVQGYMAAGKTVVGMIDGAAKEVIEESGCGVCVPAGDEEALAAAMKQIVLHPEQYAACGEKGREYFRAHFSKSQYMRELEKNMYELTEKEYVTV